MKVRFEITDGVNPIRIVEPFIGTDGSISWKKEDAPKFDFKKELKEITLLKEDFKHFYKLEKSENRCDIQNLNVYLNCGMDEILLFTGEFTMSKGVWDLDRCTVKFKVSTFDPYKCIKDNDDKVNILNLTIIPTTAKLPVTIEVEVYLCYVRPMECDPVFIKNGLWTFHRNKNLGPLKVDVFVRHLLKCPCDYYPSVDWKLLEGCLGGQKKYIKKFESNDPDKRDFIDFDNDYNIENNYIPVNEIDNGRELQLVMQGLLNAACTGLYIKSDFFQWNPDISTPINYVTQELNRLTNILIFQKSDVKRATNSNNATKAMASFKDMVEQVCNIFNCRYQIQGETLRIEHLSWFERDFGIDLLNNRNKELLKGTRKYSYDESNLPRFEKFEFMEAGSIDFVGVPIEYKNNCVNNDEENRTEINVDQITTDVMYAIENPDPDGDVSDDGFVIVACDMANNVYYEDGILSSDTTINNTLSWAHLQRDYWKHGRVFMNGYMNNNPTEFKSIVPTIKQDKFSAILNCNELKRFNPIDQIKGALGWGFVQSAEFKLSKCVMDFNLYLDNIEQPSFEQEDYGDFDDDFSEDFD